MGFRASIPTFCGIQCRTLPEQTATITATFPRTLPDDMFISGYSAGYGASRIEDNALYLLDFLARATRGYLVGRTVTGHVELDRTVGRSLSPHQSSHLSPRLRSQPHIFSLFGVLYLLETAMARVAVWGQGAGAGGVGGWADGRWLGGRRGRRLANDSRCQRLRRRRGVAATLAGMNSE
jgi:hypothetical protein